MHAFVVNNVYNALSSYFSKHPLGYVFSDGLIYLMETEGEQLRGARVPDVSFVHKERIPADYDLNRPFPGAPDLAVEVVSPGDSAKDILTKVREYLSARSIQVWVLYPEQKELHQYLRDIDTVRLYAGDDIIDAEALFPEIKLITKALFKLPDLGE